MIEQPCPQTSPHPAHRYMLGCLVHQCPGTAEQPVHPYASLDPDDGRDTVTAGAIDDYLGRKLLDQMSDAELAALYDRAEKAEAERDKACTAFNAKVMQLEKAERAANLLADCHRRAEHADSVTAEVKRLMERRTTTLRSRAERAEAALTRIRAALNDAEWGGPDRADVISEIRTALDEPKEPRT